MKSAKTMEQRPGLSGLGSSAQPSQLTTPCPPLAVLIWVESLANSKYISCPQVTLDPDKQEGKPLLLDTAFKVLVRDTVR